MFLRQMADPNLSQYAYILGCQRTGEALVVDPERDVDRYRAVTAAAGLRITAVAETHIHADFVSGARELAVDPQVRVYLSAEGGPEWQSEWAAALPNVTRLRHGDRFQVGRIDLQALHTPGHTPEHLAYLVTDRGGGADEPVALLSGDFLFVGDAGRPDLLEQAAGLRGSQDAAARALYRSLREIVSLPCHVQVLPAHGAGSACGKALGAVPHSTLGYEMKFNPAWLRAQNDGEDDFVRYILSGQPEPPAYFATMKRVNRDGPALLGALPQPGRISVETWLARPMDRHSVVVDTRSRAEFLAGHLPGSLFAPPEKFSDFVGSYLRPDDAVVLVVENPDDAEPLVRQLVRMGFDQVAGVIAANEVAALPATRRSAFPTLTFAELPEWLGRNPDAEHLDVRKATEFQEFHRRGSGNVAHTRLLPRLDEVPSDRPVVVSCGSGLRAAGACAFLAREGRRVVCVNDSIENLPPGDRA